jgi:hypothetical protein
MRPVDEELRADTIRRAEGGNHVTTELWFDDPW